VNACALKKASSSLLARGLATLCVSGLLAGAALAQTAGAPSPGLGESVAAVVNGEIISSYDLKQRIRLLFAITPGLQPTEENITQAERESLRQLIDERLELQEIRHVQERQKDYNPIPNDQQIDSAIGELAQRQGMTAQQFQTALRQDGIDPRTLREELKAQRAWQRYIYDRYRDNVAVGQDQIRAAMQRALAAAEKARYLVSEIYIDAAKVGGEAAAVDGANQLITQIQQGAPFATVAQQFSGRPSAANGGDEGWLNAGQIQPPEVERALEQMRPGQVSQAIPVAGGVYIVALRDKQAGAGVDVVNLKQAAVSLPASATPEQVAEAQRKLEALRGQITGCDSLEADAGKVSGVIAGDLGEAEVKDLTPEFQKAIAPLKVGQVSEPVRSPAGLHLVALCGRHAKGAKTPTRDDIQSQLENEQFSMIERRALRDLRNSATIESR
jgi:peptidyl-prolyl cis-trans isomerase SurA